MKNGKKTTEEKINVVSDAVIQALKKVQGSGKSEVIKTGKKTANKKPATETSAEATTCDLTFKVDVVAAPVDAAALQAEANLRSEQLFGSAAGYYENDLMIKELQAIPKIELTRRAAELETRMAKKEQFDAMMADQPQGVQQQFAVDLFIVRIDKTMPTSDKDIIEIFNKIEAMGRGRKPADLTEVNKIQKENRLFFIDDANTKHHLLHNLSQMTGREGQVSGADRRIFASVRSLIWRLKQCQLTQKQREDDAIKAKIEEIRAYAGGDLRNFKRKMSGVYVAYLPGKVVDKKTVGMPGAAKVEIYAFSIKGGEEKIGLRILEGAGCLKPKWEAHEKYGHTVPFWWFEDFYNKKPLPPSVPEEMRESVLSYFRKLNVAVVKGMNYAWRNDTQKQDEQQSAESMEASVAAKEFAEQSAEGFDAAEHEATDLAEASEPELMAAS